MTTLPLNAPNRPTPNWNDQLTKNQYAVFLTNINSTTELTLNGNPRPRHTPPVCYIFEDFATAKAFCQTQSTQFPDMRCQIFDRQGKAVAPILTMVHPKHTRLDNPKSHRRLILLGWLLIAISPFPVYLDYRHGGLLIVPTFIGINSLIFGLRFIYMGHHALWNHQDDNARLAEHETKKPDSAT